MHCLNSSGALCLPRSSSLSSPGHALWPGVKSEGTTPSSCRPLILLPALATMEAIHGHILDLEELEILARTRSDPNSNPPPEGVAHSASAGTKQSPQGPHSCPDPGLPLCLHGASCWLYGYVLTAAFTWAHTRGWSPTPSAPPVPSALPTPAGSLFDLSWLCPQEMKNVRCCPNLLAPEHAALRGLPMIPAPQVSPKGWTPTPRILWGRLLEWP